MRYRMIYLTGLLIVVSQIAGCASYQKQKELEKVAKDWCLTIRASQVIPVYPLTEDLEPGDIFLVQTPIPKQAEEYKKRGFLPLDQHMTRISKLDYQTFYKKFYGINTHTDTPHHWQRLYSAPDANSDPNIYDPNKHLLPTHWHEAPRAAFPSYTFKVNSTVGFQAALPIKGIPVGLSMIQAEKATGSVIISDAYTYGIPFDELSTRVYVWARKPANRDVLQGVRSGVVEGEPWLDRLGRFVFAPISGKSERTIYIRVINRVYLTGRVDVSLRNTTSGNVWGKGGWFQKSTGPNLVESNDVNDLVTRYNKVIKVSDPKTDIGGKFNVIWATNRSVSLSEAFDRPLVIGYLGFDFPVMPDGSLGAPISTQNQLSGKGATYSESFDSASIINMAVEKELTPLIDSFISLDSTDSKDMAAIEVFNDEAAKVSNSKFVDFEEFATGGPDLDQVIKLRKRLETTLRINF